jgi:hypothetical protein
MEHSCSAQAAGSPPLTLAKVDRVRLAVDVPK